MCDTGGFRKTSRDGDFRVDALCLRPAHLSHNDPEDATFCTNIRNKFRREASVFLKSLVVVLPCELEIHVKYWHQTG